MWQRSMRRPPRPQDNERDDVDEHRNDKDDDDGDDDDDHLGAVETNAGESNGAKKNRDSSAFAVEEIRQFNANIIACHLTTEDRRWYIVVCYLAPFDNTTIRYVESAMVEWPS